MKITIIIQSPFQCSKSSHTLSIEINLKATGQELKQRISRDSDVATDRLKLISAGRIIEDGVALSAQLIKVE